MNCSEFHTKCIGRIEVFSFGHGGWKRARVRGLAGTESTDPDSGLSSPNDLLTVVVFLPLLSLREGRNPTKLWLPKAQPVLQTRLLQSGWPSPLPLNLSIISSTSLFHQDKPNRFRVCQGGVADMGQPTVFGTKSVRLSYN